MHGIGIGRMAETAEEAQPGARGEARRGRPRLRDPAQQLEFAGGTSSRSNAISWSLVMMVASLARMHANSASRVRGRIGRGLAGQLGQAGLAQWCRSAGANSSLACGARARTRSKNIVALAWR